MDISAELKQLETTVEIHKGLDDLSKDIRRLKTTDPEFAELVRTQFLRIISHIQSEQRSRVMHGTFLMEHAVELEKHRKLLEGTTEQEGIAVVVRTWKKRTNYILGLLIGLAAKAVWDFLTAHQ